MKTRYDQTQTYSIRYIFEPGILVECTLNRRADRNQGYKYRKHNIRM